MDILDILKADILSKVSHKFSVEKYEIGPYKSFTFPKYLPMMIYKVNQYKVNNMGNLSVLECRTRPLIKILTAVITPDLSTNIPFVIIDFIKIKNKVTILFEFFDEHTNEDQYIAEFREKMVSVKNKYNYLTEYVEKPQWYSRKRASYSVLKCGKKDELQNIQELIKEVLYEFVIFVEKADKPTNCIAGKVIVDIFREELINKGNPGSTPISKALGKHKGREFFEEVIFYLDDDTACKKLKI